MAEAVVMKLCGVAETEAGVTSKAVHATPHNRPLHINRLMLRSTLIDELGYLPIDKTGADLLFQIISQRYERGSTIISTNRVFKKWAEIFNNDATLTSAVLDRLLHHAETVIIEGKSYRMKDQIVEP
jgi:DNA replication protein DnaC